MYCADDREEERMLCPFFEKDPVCRWVGGSALAVLSAEVLVMEGLVSDDVEEVRRYCVA